MKIAYCSDLHLEFYPVEINNTEGADILILAGDICIAEHFNRLSPEKTDKKSKKLAELAKNYLDFFSNVSKEFDTVLYVLGNHEHYYSDISKTYHILSENLRCFDNIHVLENETFELDNYLIHCCTLWTNMNNSDPLTRLKAKRSLTDFNVIKNESVPSTYKYGKTYFKPEDSVALFDNSINCLKHSIKNYNKELIVVTHHAPSIESTLLQFQSSLLNYCYYSDLKEFIYNNSIKYWIHGHCHNNSDYVIYNTNILANPRGYFGHEATANNFKIKYINT